jgi:lipoate-protein ligase A
MFVLDCSFDSPAHNLACDEALLEWCEEENAGEMVRFWESPKYFVVLGYTKPIAQETDEAACAALDIPILRRCSGGGTVLQGPGSWNYSLILNIERDPQLQSVTGSNSYIMERQRDVVASLLDAPVEISGHTDLTWQSRKFSGNAQRRKRKYLLFHGTLLLDFDLSLIEKTLALPTVRPKYRADRQHSDFLVNLHLSRFVLRQQFVQAWQADEPLSSLPIERTEFLAQSKYLNPDWNRKF